MKLCDYGCGREANHQFKNGKWCCEKTHNKCPINKQKNSEGLEKRPKKIKLKRKIFCEYGCGKRAKFKLKNEKMCCSISSNKCEIFREKISKSRIGKILSKKSREKISKKNKGKYIGNKSVWFGKKHTEESKNKNRDSNKKWILNNPLKVKKLRDYQKSEEHREKMSKLMEKLWKEEWFRKSHTKYSDEELSEIKKYYRKVLYYTRKSIKKFLNLINPENKKLGYYDNHIDHIYSISDGFKNEIKPKIVGSWINLQPLPLIKNLSKNSKSWYSIKELMEKYNENCV